eukprot:5747730-Karenia_brevis.AAC.1
MALDNPLVHPFVCKSGPARLGPHRSLCHTLARMLRKSGAHVDMESSVPQLYTYDEYGNCDSESILDDVSSHP